MEANIARGSFDTLCKANQVFLIVDICNILNFRGLLSGRREGNLPQETKAKDLGIIVTKKLFWSDHSENGRQKVYFFVFN